MNGSALQPVGAKSGEAVLVSVVPSAYVTVMVECVVTLQLVGMRVNGFPPSVPLTVVDMCVSAPASGPSPARLKLSTDWTLPDGVWTSCTATCVGAWPGAPVMRSIPAASVRGFGGGTRYAVSDAPTPGMGPAEPLPIWQAGVYCTVFTQVGLALRLASTPGTLVILTAPGEPCEVSSTWFCV